MIAVTPLSRMRSLYLFAITVAIIVMLYDVYADNTTSAINRGTLISKAILTMNDNNEGGGFDTPCELPNLSIGGICLPPKTE